MDALTNSVWNELVWQHPRPTRKPLPDNGASETSPLAAANMGGIKQLLHLDEATAVGALDKSGNNSD